MSKKRDANQNQRQGARPRPLVNLQQISLALAWPLFIHYFPLPAFPSRAGLCHSLQTTATAIVTQPTPWSSSSFSQDPCSLPRLSLFPAHCPPRCSPAYLLRPLTSIIITFATRSPWARAPEANEYRTEGNEAEPAPYPLPAQAASCEDTMSSFLKSRLHFPTPSTVLYSTPAPKISCWTSCSSESGSHCAG